MSTRSAAAAAADCLEENASNLVATWVDWVRERVPTDTIDALPERALRNHIPPVLLSLAKFIRDPVELARGELLANLRLHGEVRRDQGYSMAEVLAEFDGLSELVTRSVHEAIIAESDDFDTVEVLEIAKRLGAGLRSISYIAMGTFSESDARRSHQISQNLENLARAITHEMRNPLNSLALGIELIREVELNESLHRQLDIMDSSVSRCRYLLDTIQILTVAETARAGQRMVSIQDALRRIVQEFAPSAKANGVEILIDEEIPELRVEALLLYIVLANLLSNAIKYCDQNKDERWIRVSARYIDEEHDSGFCEITVTDNGVGIAQEFVPRVFQQGFRAHAEIAEGTGIGLYLVQQTIAARGGNVELESTDGEGTTVTATMRCLHSQSDALTADQFRVEHLMGEKVWNEITADPAAANTGVVRERLRNPD